MVSDKLGIEERAVYPYSVDVSADPERRYIFTIYFLTKWSCAALFVAMIAAIAISVHERFRSASPALIHWDEQNFEFGWMLPGGGDAAVPVRVMDGQGFVEEYFLRTFMTHMFTSQRDADWCDCRAAARPGLFERGRDCFICNFSSHEVFSEAVSTLRTSEARDFRINNLRLINSVTVLPDRSIGNRIMGRLLGEVQGYGTTVSWFRADFLLGSSHITAYYTVRSPYPNGNYFFTVESARYIFNPGGGGA